MKFSELWLREWVSPSIGTIELVNKMTMSGLKMNISDFVICCFSGVVIGNISHISIHPRNCTLQINKIDIGGVRLFHVISKLKKYKKNFRVAVALSGAKLPGNLHIKCIEIGGELSEGVLCSFSSLGLVYNDKDTIDDIIELPIDAPLGQDLKNYLQCDDNVIDVAVTPNRGDCLNIMGIAHDVAAIYRLPVKIPKINIMVPEIDDVISISIDVPHACPHYFSRIIKNINLSALTPLWMKEKLRRCGIQLENIVTDITNYVLLELGQPIHIFNLDNIYGALNIRWAKEGEKLKLPYVDNEIIFTSDTLIIADAIHPIGIAGVVVGDIATVDILKTSNIFLESAFFNPFYVVRSSRQYKLFTHSTYRYERQGVNPNISRLALERVTFFLISICGGVSGKIMSIIHKDMLPQRITIILRRSKLDTVLGYFIEDHEVIDILIYLKCDVVQEKNNNLWKVLAPIHRFDIKIEEDLIEEIIRLHGYDKIVGAPVYGQLNFNKKDENQLLLSRSKMLLVDRGYQEVITYSFIDSKIQHLLYPYNESVVLLNPLTSDMSVMRSSLWIGLLKALLYNQSRQQKNIRLFEYGICFVKHKNNTNQIYQNFMLSGIMTGSRFDKQWNIIPHMLDFYDIKGDVELLLEIHGKLDEIKFQHQTHSALHPTQSAAIFLNGQHIGCFGVIHPILEKKLYLKSRTFVFELLWEKISQNIKIPRIMDVPKFPINRRDISIIVSEDISSDEIISECKKVIKNQLIDIKIFDVYQGNDIPRGFRSLSISLYIYHCLRTLQEEDIELIITECTCVLQNKFAVFLRKK